MIASKGSFDAVLEEDREDLGAAEVDCDVRSVTEVEDRRSVAEVNRPPVLEDWDCEVMYLWRGRMWVSSFFSQRRY